MTDACAEPGLAFGGSALPFIQPKKMTGNAAVKTDSFCLPGQVTQLFLRLAFSSA